MDNYIHNKAAVFIDYENINLTDSYNLLFKKLIKEGYNPVIRKLVCSTLPKKANFTDVIKNNLLDFIVSYKPLKQGTSKIIKEKNLNNADFRVYIEVLKILYTKQDINTFVIATSDDDYYELIQAIKNEGKYLIGVGNKLTTSTVYKELFNEFYFIEDLNETNPIQNTIVETKEHKVEEKTIEKKNVAKKQNNKKQNKTQKSKPINNKKQSKSKKPIENKVKEESKKDEIFYSVLKNAITEQLNNAASKNDKTYFIANLISDIKTDFPYLKTYRKITKKDIEKCGFEIEFENDEKVKGFIKTK